ncbi:MAG TPA: ABC transporter permease subunit [Actinotalea sp.]|nr:ABC transporter permease subunit [Actinotalea sp.]
MTRLVWVELQRLAARRLVLGALLATLVAIGLVLWGTAATVRPLTAAQLEEAERAYALALADWEENGEEQVAQCREDQEREREASDDPTLDFGCDQMGAPERAWYVPVAPALEDTLPGVLAPVTFLIGFMALLVGATSTAAELSSGAITTWLTFEPRRLRVYASKLLAVGAGLVPAAVLTLALLVAGVWAVHAQQDLAGTMSGADWQDTLGTTLRMLVVIVLGGVAGAAMGIWMRHTAAVLGVVVGYAILVENLLGALVPRLQPALVLLNVSAWVQDGAAYYVSQCTTSSQGTSCEYVEQTLSLAQGAAYLGGLCILVVLGAGLVFRRRDVG